MATRTWVLSLTRPSVLLSTAQDLQWERHGRAEWRIYRATIPPGPLRFTHRQLFADGVYIPEARWPNARLGTMLDRQAAWASMQVRTGKRCLPFVPQNEKMWCKLFSLA